MQKLLSRVFQSGAKGAAHFLDWKEPELFVGEGEFAQFPNPPYTNLKLTVIQWLTR